MGCDSLQSGGNLPRFLRNVGNYLGTNRVTSQKTIICTTPDFGASNIEIISNLFIMPISEYRSSRYQLTNCLCMTMVQHNVRVIRTLCEIDLKTHFRNQIYTFIFLYTNVAKSQFYR